MVVVIKSKARLQGTATPQSLNEETTVVEVAAQDDDYMVEGYIDLSQLASGDAVIIREYVAVDGINYGLFCQATCSGPVSEPVVRFHSKQFLYNMKYKVTVTQTSGTIRGFKYGFVLEVLGEA